MIFFPFFNEIILYIMKKKKLYIQYIPVYSIQYIKKQQKKYCFSFFVSLSCIYVQHIQYISIYKVQYKIYSIHAVEEKNLLFIFKQTKNIPRHILYYSNLIYILFDSGVI